MRCPRCQHENEADAKFCEECAAPLARTCANCGRQLTPTAKFCPECAQPTASAPATPMAPRFGTPQTYTPKHLAEKILTSKAALEGERKQVTVLFAAPLAHEDHAVRACYAALRMQESVKRYEEEARRTHGVNVQIRVGLNSGEVVVRAGRQRSAHGLHGR